jgi:methyl-accepting chemotaxis protein
MNWFNNLKTAYKLMLGFGLCLFLSIAVGFGAITRMVVMANAASLLNSDTVTGLKDIEHFSSPMMEYRTTQYRSVLSAAEDDADQWSKDKARLDKLRQSAQKGLKDYQSSTFLPQDKANCKHLADLWNGYLADEDSNLRPALMRHDTKTAVELINHPMRDQFLAVENSIDTITSWNEQRGESLHLQAQSSFQEGRDLVIALLAVDLLASVLAGWFISRYLVRNLTDVSARLESLRSLCVTNLNAAVRAMQAGTREVEAGTARAEQAGRVLTQIRIVSEAASQQVKGIQSVTQKMRTASETVSLAMTDVAAVVEEASASTEEMSASAEQVAASLQTVAGTTAQQSGAVENLVASAQSLTMVANDLEAAVSRFRIHAEPEMPTRLTLLRAA